MFKGILKIVDRVFITFKGLVRTLNFIQMDWTFKGWGIKSVISETPLRTPHGVRRLYAKKLHGQMTRTSANQEMPTRLKNTRPNIFVRGLQPRMRMISNQRYGKHQARQICIDAKGAEAPIRELICFEQN